MGLKNAGSRSNATFEKIQKILATHGANQIMFDYRKDGSGQVEAITFGLEINGKMQGFRMPALVDNVAHILYKGRDMTEKQYEQAYKTAWANIRDWIDAQMALIDTRQAKLEQVFLPYLLIGETQTLFEKLESTQFALPSGE